MNRNLSHAIFSVGDILFLRLLWLGYQEFNLALINISKQTEIVEFNSRAGFLSFVLDCRLSIFLWL